MSVITKTKWTIDENHSLVQFKVRHLAISTVTGRFNHFEGSLLAQGEDFADSDVSFKIDANSMDTNQPKRDADLKSAQFFHTEKFPDIIFLGKLQKSDSHFSLLGHLTIRDITKDISLEAELTGVGKGRFGDIRAGFEVQGKLNRKDFGLSWNLLTEAGGLVVGEEVSLHFDVQLVKDVSST